VRMRDGPRYGHPLPAMRPAGSRTLPAIRIVHTLVWAFFVACILAIWVFALRAEFDHAALAISIVLVEVTVLSVNQGRCPLSDLAARFTPDRRASFDIFLPAWLAGRTLPIFGTLYIAGIALTVTGFGLTLH
jgi:hypothetical protein